MYGIGNERQICNLGLFYPIYELTGGGGVISFCPSRGSHSPEPHSGSRTASKGPTGSCIIHPGWMTGLKQPEYKNSEQISLLHIGLWDVDTLVFRPRCYCCLIHDVRCMLYYYVCHRPSKSQFYPLLICEGKKGNSCPHTHTFTCGWKTKAKKQNPIILYLFLPQRRGGLSNFPSLASQYPHTHTVITIWRIIAQ